MTTPKQHAANRQNAQKSTGPKTPEGKALVRLNSMQHGLLSKHVLLPDEDENALAELDKQMRAHLQPVGELESFLVRRIVSGIWRLRRVMQVEIGLFESERHFTLNINGINKEKHELGLAFIRHAHGADVFSKLSRYESTIERGLYRALHELQRLQAGRAGQFVPPPAVLDVDVSVSTKADKGEV
jgi:hypothetical protein